MFGLVARAARYGAPLLLASSGCLVSFDDYPLSTEPLGGRAGAAGDMSDGGSTAGDPGPSGGEGGVSGAPAQVAENVIDDFEDADQGILEQQGRRGSWYVVNDGRGTQSPPMNQPLLPTLLEEPRASSLRAVRTFGGPFAAWGALIGTDLSTGPTGAATYDLSAYRGVRVWLRSGSSPTAAGAAARVRLNLPTRETNPGGGCSECNDHFGLDITLTTSWRQVVVPFASLRQVGFGRPLVQRADLSSVTGIQFLFGRNVTFDLWVDDLELY